MSSEFYINKKADLIFLDGDHRYEAVKEDILISMCFLKMPGGILAGHDYGRKDWPGVKKAVDEMFGVVEVVDTIWIKRF
jgi:hypothetical protein